VLRSHAIRALAGTASYTRGLCWSVQRFTLIIFILCVERLTTVAATNWLCLEIWERGPLKLGWEAGVLIVLYDWRIRKEKGEKDGLKRCLFC